MIVALTGTPGTGKTLVADELKRLGYKVISVNEVAKKQDFFIDYDPDRETYEVDLERLNKYFLELFRNKDLKNSSNQQKPRNITFLEGHLAHHLTMVDLVLVLRCHPEQLKERLNKRCWQRQKIRENLEAEALDVITVEAIENFEKNIVFEINTTTATLENIIDDIRKILTGEHDEFRPGKFDWSEEILKWY